MDISKVPPINNRSLKTVEPLFEVAKRFKPSSEVFPVSIHEFDNVMDGGVRGGELIVVSGQTGMGKTLFCQNLTCNFHKIKIPSLWFTYEMSPWYLKEKFVNMGQKPDLLAYSPIELVANNLSFIDQEVQEAIEEYACKIIFIDHLHYLIPLQQSTNTSLMIGGIVRELKKMAIAKDIVIFLVAHTKKVYQDEALSLTSIRDSSLISCEASYVFLVERMKKEEKKLGNTGTEWLNETKITLAKNRRTGKMIFLNFRFDNEKLIPITMTYEEEAELKEKPTKNFGL